MSEASAIAAVPSAAPAQRPLRGVDLYAEGNSFPEPDGLSVERLFGTDGVGFKDLVDIVNPLQHLPVVGTLYRALTGDALAPGSRILGGTLFGGIGGFVTALINAVAENETGSDFGDKALALFQGDAAPQPRLAEAGAAETVAAATPNPAAPPGAVPAQAPPAPAPDRKAFPIFAGPPRALPAASDPAENPTEALIRARAAVPASHRRAPPGLPPAAGVAATPVPARTAASDAAVALADTANTADTAPPDAAPARAATPDIAYMMRDALNKYQALKKSQGGPSISGDF